MCNKFGCYNLSVEERNMTNIINMGFSAAIKTDMLYLQCIMNNMGRDIATSEENHQTMHAIK